MFVSNMRLKLESHAIQLSPSWPWHRSDLFSVWPWYLGEDQIFEMEERDQVIQQSSCSDSLMVVQEILKRREEIALNY